MSMIHNQPAAAEEADDEVFDRLHLCRYSMQNQDLAAEVLGLFLLQLPAMLEAVDTAVSRADWDFATHTLKGSAASIGARKLCWLAAELEAMDFPGDNNVRLLRIQAMKAAASELRRVARQAYPAAG